MPSAFSLLRGGSFPPDRSQSGHARSSLYRFLFCLAVKSALSSPSSVHSNQLHQMCDRCSNPDHRSRFEWTLTSNSFFLWRVGTTISIIMSSLSLIQIWRCFTTYSSKVFKFAWLAGTPGINSVLWSMIVAMPGSFVRMSCKDWDDMAIRVLRVWNLLKYLNTKLYSINMLYELIMKTIDSCTTFVHVIGGFDGFGRDNGHFLYLWKRSLHYLALWRVSLSWSDSLSISLFVPSVARRASTIKLTLMCSKLWPICDRHR